MTDNRISSKSLTTGEYTQEELDRIQITLSKVLGNEYISSRPGGGGVRVSYLEGWKALNLANEVFGFNGWSSEIISQTVDYCDTNDQGRISIGISIVVRVTIKDGTFHEDIGYGYIDNAKSKPAAFEKCKKEAFTDGIKRCLRCFGNVLGNCLYDKNLLSKLRNANKENSALNNDDIYKDVELSKLAKQRMERVKVGSVSTEKFNENMKNMQTNQVPAVASTTTSAAKDQAPTAPTSMPNNHHHNSHHTHATGPHSVQTQAPPPPSSVHTPAPIPVPAQPVANPMISTRSKPTDDDFDDSFLFSDDIEMNKMDDYEMEMIMNKENQPATNPESVTNSESTSHSISHPLPTEPTGTHENTSPQAIANTGFISARGADLLKTPGSDLPQFDPKFISPNIRRTLDPTKSVPVKRNEINNTPSKGKRIAIPANNRAPLKRLHKENVAN